jgi:hypothetical protein
MRGSSQRLRKVFESDANFDMRISHTQIELCLANPRTWYRASLAAESHPYLMGYERVLRLSILHFHRSSGPAARDYMTEKIRMHNLKNVGRIAEIETSFDRYVKWAAKERLKVVDAKVKIAHQTGFLELRGEIGRVDVTSTGYRAVLLGNVPVDWEQQLRMPLIQAAIALMYGRPQEKTEVGFQELDASHLATRIYSEREIQKAQHKFMALGRIVRGLERRNKPKSGSTGPFD